MFRERRFRWQLAAAERPRNRCVQGPELWHSKEGGTAHQPAQFIIWATRLKFPPGRGDEPMNLVLRAPTCAACPAARTAQVCAAKRVRSTLHFGADILLLRRLQPQTDDIRPGCHIRDPVKFMNLQRCECPTVSLDRASRAGSLAQARRKGQGKRRRH